jgi:hypothetical protein
MSSPSNARGSHLGDEERERRLADLSGAMAIARLTHQVKELELQKTQQDKLAKPTFSPINAVMYTLTETSDNSDTSVLLALDLVKRWTGEGGVSITVPLTGASSISPAKT